MLFVPDPLSFPFLALYAETHFRFFRLFPSLLYQNQPEVLFDLPRRLDPAATDLPIVLVANHVDRFAVSFSGCSIAITSPRSPHAPKRFDFDDLTRFEVDHPLRNSMKVFLLYIPRSDLFSGLIHVTAKVEILRKNRKRVVLNDNFPGTQKLPFSCFIAEEKLPGSDYCVYGDLHVHSLYSESHVEFGPPILVIDTMVHANGLAFCAITDHSYDLCCAVSNYLKPDKELTRWQLFSRELDEKRVFSSMIIPGEEISCLNKKGEVVHLCGLNMNRFIPGNLDGARKGRSKDTQYTIEQVSKIIHDQGGVAVAAHPGASAGLLQRIFLKRGEWYPDDLTNSIDAMQIMNNGISLQIERGKAMWINILKKGHKVPLLAGNDAHGDFNRYRAITTPFVSISDSQENFFGNGKTGIYGAPRTISAIMTSIQQGKTFITTGPFLSMSVSGSRADNSAISHSPISPEINKIYVHARSTAEFGPICAIRAFAGKKDADAEALVFSGNYGKKGLFSIDEQIDLNTLKKGLIYLRAECTCSSPQKAPSEAFTSPMYWG